MLTDEHPLVLFDGFCNFCSRSVRLILRNDRHGNIRFAAIQSPTGERVMKEFGLDSSATDSFVVVRGRRAFLRSDAALEIARDMRFPWNWAAALRVVPRPLRDWAYGFIARNRYRWFGRKEACFIPTDEERSRFL